MSLIGLTEPVERDRIMQVTVTLSREEFAKFHLLHKPSYIGTYSMDYEDVAVHQHYYAINGTLVMASCRIEKEVE